MSSRWVWPSIALLALSNLCGCATSRSEIALVTKPAAISAVESAPTVTIRSVIDERVFMQSPPDPSTPSLGGEGANAASAETKARAIGRKRNTFGKALGDVLLQNGQTVDGLVRDNLATALQAAGYRVVPNNTAPANALVLDVRIKQFWAWFQPGFWALKLHTRIETELKRSDATVPTVIRVDVEDSRQMATDSAWIEVIDKGLAAYRAKVQERASEFKPLR